jgi:hypothetical protein
VSVVAASDGAGLLGPVLGFAGTVIAALIAAAAQIRANRKKGDSFTLLSRASIMLAVAVLLAVVGTVTVIARSRRDGQTGARSPATTIATSVMPDGRVTSSPSLPKPQTGQGMSIEFDDGIKLDSIGRSYVEDASVNGHVAIVLKDNGGEVASVPRDEGLALKFPEPCVQDTATACPRAYLEIASAGDLNPGTRDFSFGADVLATAAQAKRGADIVRKGFPRGVDVTGQWRLQLEEEGRLSCAVTGKGSNDSLSVTSIVRVDDATWHRIQCVRSGSTLKIQVDGSDPISRAIPADLVVESPIDVRVGGGEGSNEQFFGMLDNVYLSIA